MSAGNVFPAFFLADILVGLRPASMLKFVKIHANCLRFFIFELLKE